MAPHIWVIRINLRQQAVGQLILSRVRRKEASADQAEGSPGRSLSSGGILANQVVELLPAAQTRNGDSLTSLYRASRFHLWASSVKPTARVPWTRVVADILRGSLLGRNLEWMCIVGQDNIERRF